LGEGAIDLAEKIIHKTKSPAKKVKHIYDVNEPLDEKIRKIAQTVYGADDIELSPKAQKQIAFYEQQGWGDLPVCMAKTQYSLSENPALIGRQSGFTVNIMELKPAIGAGFIVVLTGAMMTMPGLPKHPA